MITVELKTNFDLKRIISAAFPDYKKKTAWISPFSERGVQINSYYDGGTRSLFAIVNLETGECKPLPTQTHPYYNIAAKGLTDQSNGVLSVDRGGNVTLMVLPEGYALVEAGSFCGKPATAHIFLNSANMPKYLEAPKA